MRLLVLGGTVFLSKAVAASGVTRGHDVTVAARGVSGAPPDGARFVEVDRDHPGSLAALRGERFDAVVDVARLPIHVGRALDAVAANAGHWTFVSTCSVYADHSTPGQTAGDAPLVEPTAPDSADPDLELYGPSKVACESLVRERAGDRAFLVRAGLLVGPGDPNDRFGYWPDRIAAGGEILAPGDPEDDVQYVDVRDLAAWIVDAAERGVTGTYDGICSPIPRESFLDEIAEGMGTRPDFTWVPSAFLLERGVSPWAGEESLGLWMPLPGFGGFLSRDVSASLEAGLEIRPLAETARDWYEARVEPPELLASLSREKEAEILSMWHTKEEP